MLATRDLWVRKVIDVGSRDVRHTCGQGVTLRCQSLSQAIARDKDTSSRRRCRSESSRATGTAGWAISDRRLIAELISVGTLPSVVWAHHDTRNNLFLSPVFSPLHRGFARHYHCRIGNCSLIGWSDGSCTARQTNHNSFVSALRACCVVLLFLGSSYVS